VWEYTSPRSIVFGPEALEYLKEVKGERALIITDKVIERLGFVEKALSYLEKAGIDTKVYDEVEADPSTETVKRGAKIARDYDPDWFIALGGGSTIDTAKAIWVLFERPDLRIEEISPLMELGLRKKARLICIPTTSGTGSDATWAIVITDEKEQRKMELASREVVPDLSILDPCLTSTMPRELMADSGMDAVSHAIEAYVSQWRNDFSDAMAIKALQLIFEYLPKAYLNPTDDASRERMHNAATMFSNSQLGIAHAMAHAIGAIFHVPHGRALSMVLPYVMEYNAKEAKKRYAEIATATGIEATSPEEATEKLIEAVRGLSKLLSEPDSIGAGGISWERYSQEFDRLVDRAIESTTTMADPRVPSVTDLKRLFICAFKGHKVDF